MAQAGKALACDTCIPYGRVNVSVKVEEAQVPGPHVGDVPGSWLQCGLPQIVVAIWGVNRPVER